MRIRGTARGCWGALVILRELPDRGSEWFPSNVARNSHACILGFEIRSLELQRLWPISKNDRVKLRATFGGVVTSVTFGPLCQAPPLHRPRPFTELRPETWTLLMVAVMRLPVGSDPGILPGSGP